MRILVVLMLLAVVVRLAFPESGRFMRKLIVPGMPDSAYQAFTQMLSDMREGMEIASAIDVFYDKIVADARP